MAQTETLQKVLAAPADASRVKQLQTVHEAITASLSSQLPSARVGLETLVSCAEAALKVSVGSGLQDKREGGSMGCNQGFLEQVPSDVFKGRFRGGTAHLPAHTM